MTRSFFLFTAFWAGLAGLEHLMGYDTAYDAGYGAISLVAVVISVTFGWLWRIRATPMALGMAFSWAGCSGLVGYWWVFNQLARTPLPGREHQILWAFLALYLAGSVAHLRVIASACGGGRALLVSVFGVVLAVALAMAAFVT